MPTKVLSIRAYASVFAGLLIGFFLNVSAAFLDLGRFHEIVAVAIAGCQALLVILFFMHVRYGNRVLWLFAGAGFFWLLILLVLAMSDYLSRGWDLRL